MKKGILFVPFMTGKGGTESVVHNLFQSLQGQNNINLTVYSIGGSDEYGWTNGVNAKISEISHSRKLRTLYYLLFLPSKIYKIIKNEQPDFVISTNPIMWFLSKKAVQRLKLDIPVIAWYHYSLQQKPIKSLFLKSADYFLAISSGIRNQLVARGIQQDKIFLIYNPVTSDYQPIKRPDNVTHFIYLGRVDLNKQKNVQELMHALALLHGKWELDVYGDDSKATNVKDLAKTLNINDQINWEGFVANPWSKIPSASALVLTSKYEGLPMVLCEAISHGIYGISSNVATGPADIINSSNGALYHPGNIQQLAEQLQSVIDHPEKMPLQSTIINSSKKFSIDNYGHYFINALNTILNK
ncbi:glycosyltransferase [Limosilactobacillus caecicola]|uniref:glycosyltransferase n=1 Tax=Limosilactobacillus caecicola TaxID=2941332 RepID=UPI00203C64BE|nr:glycosyltransferase [Limosilactobacillus caecicola]